MSAPVVHLADEGGPAFAAAATAPVVSRILADFIAHTRAYAAALAEDAAIEHARDNDRDEAFGSTCSAGCGFCGMCS